MINFHLHKLCVRSTLLSIYVILHPVLLWSGFCSSLSEHVRHCTAKHFSVFLLTHPF
jgi:hypothetical protein